MISLLDVRWLVGLIVFMHAGRTLESGEAEVELNDERWELTFSDEFEGEKLDYDKWMPKDPWGAEKNQELQGYVIKAFHLDSGILKIRCENEPSFYDGKKRDYRSGMMTTEKKFSQKFGKFEIRCRVPKGKGLWPAFWMLPEPKSWPPEIDVLEILGGETDRVYFSHHWINPSNPEGKSLAQTGEFAGVDFAAEFHTFTLIWEEEKLRWFVDGTLRHQSSEEIPQVPMFLLVNLAVGGWAGAPDASTRFPANFEVDYVRVWQMP